MGISKTWYCRSNGWLAMVSSLISPNSSTCSKYHVSTQPSLVVIHQLQQQASQEQQLNIKTQLVMAPYFQALNHLDTHHLG